MKRLSSKGLNLIAATYSGISKNGYKMSTLKIKLIRCKANQKKKKRTTNKSTIEPKCSTGGHTETRGLCCVPKSNH